MAKNNKPVQITQAEVAAIATTTNALCDAIDEVQDDLKHTLLTQATIETKQETILTQLTGLTGTINGPHGLVSQMAVVRASIKQSALPEVAKELAVMESKIDALEKKKTEEVNQGNSNRSANIAAVAAVLAGLAIVISLVQSPGCRPSTPDQPSATKASAPI